VCLGFRTSLGGGVAGADITVRVRLPNLLTELQKRPFVAKIYGFGLMRALVQRTDIRSDCGNKTVYTAPPRYTAYSPLFLEWETSFLFNLVSYSLNRILAAPQRVETRTHAGGESALRVCGRE
jgi:hypothetical protein